MLRLGRLAVEQQRQPFGVVEILGAVLRLQLGEGVGHAVELQRSQLVEGGMCQHCVVFSSVEVARATDVGVDYRRPVRGGCGPLAIEVGLQDRVDRGVGARADLQRPVAGGLQPLGARSVLASRRMPTQARKPCSGCVRSRRMISTSAEVLGADLAGLPPEALRRPVGVAPVARRHVLAHRRVLAVR